MTTHRQISRPLPESPIALMRRLIQIHGRLYGSLARKGTLTKTQFLVAQALQCDARSQAALVNLTSIDRSTLSKTVQTMRRDGLLTITSSLDDARANSVMLTDKGIKFLRRAESDFREAEREMFANTNSHTMTKSMKQILIHFEEPSHA